MEQTVNTFNKGLVTDTNPMVQSTETLTDALNGTFVTMNGDELVLQNDMGNRRVDNAFLPSGYQPVGMKEYGGIIYVAAYNPITNKSQLGSFPSPERKLGNDKKFSSESFELITNESETWTEQWTEDDWTLESFQKWLKTDSILVPLTKDFNIHIGDKFGLVSSYNTDTFSSYWSNMFNTTEDNNELSEEYKIISPKNKLYSLQFGVLNSSNEFVNLTSTLSRYDENSNMINGLHNYSDLYRTNRGTILMKTLGQNEIHTSDDQIFIEERQKKELNTYAYKLIGPLYVKILINHIQDFQYNIFAKKSSDEQKIELYITTTIIYNSPDGYTNFKDQDDNDYKNLNILEEGILDQNGYSFYDLFTSTYNGIQNNYSTKILSSEYNKELNLYTIKLKRLYTIDINDNINELSYYICPKIYNRNIYLKELSSKGSINLSLIGSGLVNLKSWNFKNIVSTNSEGEKYLNTTYFRYNLEAYPEFEGQFRNLRLQLENIQNPIDIHNIVLSDLVTNSSNVITLPSELLFRKMYKGNLVYDEYDEEGNIINESIEISNIWLLTTALLNSKYDQDKNFSDFLEEGIPLNVPVDNNVSLNTIQNDTKIPQTKLYDLEQSNIPLEFEFTTTNTSIAQIDSEINFDIDLLPDYLSLNINNINQELHLGENTEVINNEILRNSNNSEIQNNDPIIKLEVNGVQFKSKRIELAKADSDSTIINVKNAFNNLKNLIQDDEWFDSMVQIGSLDLLGSSSHAAAHFSGISTPNKLIYPSKKAFENADASPETQVNRNNFYIAAQDGGITYNDNTLPSDSIEDTFYKEEANTSIEHFSEMLKTKSKSSGHISLQKEDYYDNLVASSHIKKPFIFGYSSSELNYNLGNEWEKVNNYRILWIKNGESLIPLITTSPSFDPRNYDYISNNLEQLQKKQKKKAQKEIEDIIHLYDNLLLDIHYKYNKENIVKTFRTWKNPISDYVDNSYVINLVFNTKQTLALTGQIVSNNIPEFIIANSSEDKSFQLNKTINNSQEFKEFNKELKDLPLNVLEVFDFGIKGTKDLNQNLIQNNSLYIYDETLKGLVKVEILYNDISAVTMNMDGKYRLLLINSLNQLSNLWRLVNHRDEGRYLFFEGLPQFINAYYKYVD